VKTEIWTIKEFLRNESPRVERKGIHKLIASTLSISMMLAPSIALASYDHPVSKAFDTKIWPLMIDIGEPLAKTMMAIGIYKCIRNDVDHGWKMIYRSGIGLIGLYLIDGAIHIIQGVGADLTKG
jgi:hypothetical protein